MDMKLLIVGLLLLTSNSWADSAGPSARMNRLANPNQTFISAGVSMYESDTQTVTSIPLNATAQQHDKREVGCYQSASSQSSKKLNAGKFFSWSPALWTQSLQVAAYENKNSVSTPTTAQSNESLSFADVTLSAGAALCNRYQNYLGFELGHTIDTATSELANSTDESSFARAHYQVPVQHGASNIAFSYLVNRFNDNGSWDLQHYYSVAYQSEALIGMTPTVLAVEATFKQTPRQTDSYLIGGYLSTRFGCNRAACPAVGIYLEYELQGERNVRFGEFNIRWLL